MFAVYRTFGNRNLIFIYQGLSELRDEQIMIMEIIIIIMAVKENHVKPWMHDE